MIIFSGKIENTIQAKVITKRGQFAGILGITITVVTIIGCLIIWLIDKRLNAELVTAFCLGGVAILVCAIICIPTSSKKLRFEWDYYIKFENELITVISNHQNGATQTYNISKIKKVVDYGKYYYLFLHRLDPSYGITCQKDLLVEGSLEEFENIFAGKIQVKNNQKT